MEAKEEAVPEGQSTPNGTGLGSPEPDGGQPTAAISIGPCRRWKRVPRRVPSSQGGASTTVSRASLQHLEAGVSVWVPQGIFGAAERSAAARRTRMTPVSARPGHSVRCDRLLVRLRLRLVDLADGVQPPAD